MKKKLVDYQDGYRVVSIAKNERVLDDLLDDQIDFLYVPEKTVILYPEQKCLSESSEVIELLFASNNYDVYEIWDNGTLTRYYDDSSIDNYFFLTSKCN